MTVFRALLSCPAASFYHRLAICPRWELPGSTYTHGDFLFAPVTSQHARHRCAGRFFSLIPTNTAGSAHPQPPGWNGMLREDQPGRSRIPPPHTLHPPHLSQPPPAPPRRRRGWRRVGPYRRAGSSSPAPPWLRSRPRSAPAAPGPRGNRLPRAVSLHPPTPAAAPALRVVMFIYIRRRRLNGFLK